MNHQPLNQEQSQIGTEDQTSAEHSFRMSLNQKPEGPISQLTKKFEMVRQQRKLN